MKLHRITALLIRHLYLYKRSLPRIMDIFYWPVMDLLAWGFLSVYLNQVQLSNLNVVSVFLGALIFWDVLNQGQKSVSVAFLEDVWERNLLNIFVTPLRPSEFLVSTALLGFIRIVLVTLVLGALSFVFYHFNLFVFGFWLIPFAVNLLLFGWTVGLFIIGIIMRYGTQAQILAFGLIFLIHPFSAVFYPVSVLPPVVQYVSYLLPATHVFEGMRAVLGGGAFPSSNLIWSSFLNVIYAVLSLLFFYRQFAHAKKKGLLSKLE